MGEEEQSRNICMLKCHIQVLTNIKYYQPQFLIVYIRIPFQNHGMTFKDIIILFICGLYIVDVLTTPFEFWQPNCILLCCFKDAR